VRYYQLRILELEQGTSDRRAGFAKDHFAHLVAQPVALLVASSDLHSQRNREAINQTNLGEDQPARAHQHTGGWFEKLKFIKHDSTFVLFNKKFPVLD
jgi:hypothetical protein